MDHAISNSRFFLGGTFHYFDEVHPKKSAKVSAARTLWLETDFSTSKD